MEDSGVGEAIGLGFSNEFELFLRVFLRESVGYEFENLGEKGCYFWTLEIKAWSWSALC
jgi:hypothetical protein